MRQAGVSDVDIGQVQLANLPQRLEVFQSGVGDRRPFQVQALQLRKALQSRQIGVARAMTSKFQLPQLG